MIRKMKLGAAIIALGFGGAALAAVSAEEAKQLGPTLTPWGAEIAGNKDGSIPAYSGQPLKPPAGYDAKDPGRHPDPFNEKPLFSITAQNAAQYADKLDAMVEYFKRYPNFRMDIYPSHRNYVYPKFVLDNSIKNATSCKGSNNELKLEGCYGGYPFPIPKTGTQVMWNHLTQYEAQYWRGTVDNMINPPNGSPVDTGRSFTTEAVPFFDPNRTTPQPSDTVYWQVRSTDLTPPRKVGGDLVLVDSLDQIGAGRRAWQYIPGQRRVKLAPDLAYDTPSPNSGGSATMDDQKVFLGAMDRWDFKLVGKKEKYIPYNTYNLSDYKVCPQEKVLATKGYFNPDCVRWELHRVWKVEATLKAGFRHIYKKRVFYWDEDAPGAGSSENYDSSGQLYRMSFAVHFPFYEAPGGVGGVVGSGGWNIDLVTGIVGIIGSGSCQHEGKSCGWYVIPDPGKNFFSPEALAGTGIR